MLLAVVLNIISNDAQVHLSNLSIFYLISHSPVARCQTSLLNSLSAASFNPKTDKKNFLPTSCFVVVSFYNCERSLVTDCNLQISN